MVRCGIHFHTVGLENNFAWRVDEGHFLNLFNKSYVHFRRWNIYNVDFFADFIKKKASWSSVSDFFFQYNLEIRNQEKRLTGPAAPPPPSPLCTATTYCVCQVTP